MIRLFASYSRKDEAAVAGLITDLGRAHLSVWHDQALHGGDPWWQDILRRIRECDVFLFALSENSLASKPCLAELSYARALGLPILPVQAGPVGNLRLTPVADIQVIDYRKQTLANGMALFEVIQDAAAGRRPLPDPPPKPPPVPFEYLLRLGSAIGAAQLTPDQQGDFIRQLRECLETEEDEGVKDDARELLRALRRRPDITYRNAAAVDQLLTGLAALEARKVDVEGADRGQSGRRRRLLFRPGADLQASGSEATVIDSDTARRRVGRRTVGLFVLLLTVLTVAAVVLVIRPKDPQPTSGSTPTPTHILTRTSGPTSGDGGSSSAPVPPSAPPSASLASPTVDGPPIPVGEKPGYMAIAPNGRYAYIANRSAGVVSVFDLTLGKTTGTIAIPDAQPQFITFAPDGKRAYISVTNADYTVNEVVFVDTSRNRPLQTVQVGKRPFAPETSPDGRLLYVPLHNEGRVEVLDTQTAQAVGSYPVAQNPHWIAVSADGTRGWTANHESGVVSVLDLANDGAVLDEIKVGKAPHSIAFSPDGSRVAVVCYESNDLWVMDANTHAVLRTVPIGLRPQDVTWAPDGAHLYTANVDGGTVSVVDTATYDVTATIPTGKSPTSVSVVPDGTRAYVTNLDDGTVVVLRTSA